MLSANTVSSMKNELIEEAIEGYEELKEEVEENPEEARERFTEILENPMWSMIGQDFSDTADSVRELDLEDDHDIEKFKSLVDDMLEKVKV